MATLASSSPTLLFSSTSSNLLPLSHSSTFRLSFSSSLQSSSLSISPTFLSHSSSTSKRFSNHAASFTITATASLNKKKVLIINTNSGGHAVIGFYFAKELLAAGHSVTIFTVGDQSSDKMNKPPFNRFSVNSSFSHSHSHLLFKLNNVVCLFLYAFLNLASHTNFIKTVYNIFISCFSLYDKCL